jgi:butyryl-CoA dehydrogenase
MGMTVPEEYGGAGRDELSHVLAIIEVSKRSASAGGLLVWNNSLYSSCILKHGSEEQKRKYLPLSVSGEKPGCLVLLESGTPANIRCKAVESGKDLTVHGEGFFPCGIQYGIAAAVSRDGKSVYFMIVDLENSAGIRRGSASEKGSIFLSGIAEAVFEGARIAGDAILRAGSDALQAILQESWLALGALASGIGRGTLEDSLEIARNEQGSGTLSQIAEWKLADMGVELEASELLVLKAAWLKERGKKYEKEAAAAKRFSVEAAVKASSESILALGGKDPGRRISIEKRMRDAGLCQVYYGTRDQLDFAVARQMGRGRITDS